MLISGRTLHFRSFHFPQDPAVVVDEEEGVKIVRTALVRSPGLSYEDAMNRTDAWMRVLDLPAMESQDADGGFAVGPDQLERGVR